VKHTNWNENSGIECQAQRPERELAALYAITHLLSAQSGQIEMLSGVLDILDRELGLARATVMLHSLDSGDLVVEAARDAHMPGQHDVRYQRGEGIVGHVLETGLPEIIRSIHDEPRFKGRIHQRTSPHDAIISFICVPVLVGSEVVGTLSADLVYQSDEQLLESQRLLSIVAGLIAYDMKTRRLAKVARYGLEAENLRLRSALGEQFRPENIIGNSDTMRTVYQRIHLVAPSDTTVLIRGESGTGKELVASAIHYGGLRADRPFVKVNCAALSESLIESELFGHEKGAFTGALYSRTGRIEEAEGGSLFLDEIGDFSPAIQVKLLRVLQEREYQRVGSNKVLKADVRIIAATNGDLEEAIRDGGFRQDLYYRINVFPIHLPPLRQRITDIVLLADHFVAQLSSKMGKDVRRISTAALDAMLAYHWPGNVRELQNCIEHAMLLSSDGVLHAHHLPPSLQMPDAIERPRTYSLKASVQILEKDMIIDALKRHNGNVTAASSDLGITARMVRYKMRDLGIDYTTLFKKRRVLRRHA